MSTRDIIDAIESGNSIAMEAALEESILSRVADQLADMKVQVAQSMFNPENDED